jgi:hypothetical protein
MYQSKQARDQKENPSLLPAVGKAPRPAFRPSNPSRHHNPRREQHPRLLYHMVTVAQKP